MEFMEALVVSRGEDVLYPKLVVPFKR